MIPLRPLWYTKAGGTKTMIQFIDLIFLEYIRELELSENASELEIKVFLLNESLPDNVRSIDGKDKS